MSDEWKELELFNAHQQGSQLRCEFIAKAIFLISGTALTVSINLFLGDKATKIPATLTCLLRLSWGALFISIVGFVLVFGFMIIRDYTFGERWRKRLSDKEYRVVHLRWPDTAMWISGTLSVIAFLFGLAGLAWVSCSLIALPVR